MTTVFIIAGFDIHETAATAIKDARIVEIPQAPHDMADDAYSEYVANLVSL